MKNILHSGSFVDRDDNAIRVTFYWEYSLEMNKEVINTDANEHTYRLRIWSMDGQAVIKYAESAWLSYTYVSRDAISGTDFYYYNYDITVRENLTGEDRTGTIRVGIMEQDVTTVSRVLTVNQTGEASQYDPEAPTYLEYLMWANPMSVTIPEEGGSARIKVAPKEYNMTMDYDWVGTTTQETGYDNTEWLIFNAEANTTGSTRTAYCTLVNGEYTASHPEGRKIVSITQENSEVNPYELYVNPSYITVGREGGSNDVYLTPKDHIRTTFECDWCFISFDIVGDSMKYTLRTLPNDGQYPRSYTFIVWRDDVDGDEHPESEKNITIYQEA